MSAMGIFRQLQLRWTGEAAYAEADETVNECVQRSEERGHRGKRRVYGDRENAGRAQQEHNWCREPDARWHKGKCHSPRVCTHCKN